MVKKGNSRFKAKRITRTYRQNISGTAETVFPLLCPVREAEWLEGWRYQIIHSVSGLAEEGCVFATPGNDEEDTVWVITRHDTAYYEVDFVRFTPASRTCVLKIAVTPDGESDSTVDISYTYTGITEEGNAWIDNFTEESFLEAVKFWERSMNHFLKTGEKLLRRHGDTGTRR
jgi:hypothetical protein